jgi:hypothetical protein
MCRILWWEKRCRFVENSILCIHICTIIFWLMGWIANIGNWYSFCRTTIKQILFRKTEMFMPFWFLFFFFYGRYNPLWTLASFTIAFHWSRSCDFRLQFLTPIVLKSSTESSHPIAGLPTCRLPSGLCRVDVLQGFCSCILKRCPSHLRRPTLITFTISGSLYNL